MEHRLSNLRKALEDSLDDLSSPRTSNDVKTHALRSLEKLLASAFVPNSSTEDIDYFLALQYTFECNVPSRILSWIASTTFRLDLLIKQGTITPEAEPEVATLTAQLTLALSIIQGVCLTHAATKIFLGRRYALEVLLDLFISSRHLSSTPFAGTTNTNDSPAKPVPGAPLPLASVILDTLLCILVDSSPALRVFESCHGVHAVVKILKRAGTPREVRMKCLEFLYFYLLDETTASLPVETPALTPAPTAPSTPMHVQPTSKKPFPNATPSRPMSRYGSSTFSLTSSSFNTSSAFSSTPYSSSSSSSSSGSGSGSESGMKSRSTSGSSTSSFSSTSSNAGSTPRSRSPKKPSAEMGKHTQTPTTPTPRLQPRALMMLRKDLDFVPLSPKRAVVAGEDGAPLGKPRGVARTRSRLVSDEDKEDSACDGAKIDSEIEDSESEQTGERMEIEEGEGTGERARETRETRTTEEKKKLLGTMLGNVEALVEGVRKAGIWGLG
ncbi:cell division control protein 14, SIN component-domain-containing protein [Mycena sanguinolenta]|nr:cell division control protein 14, SIN component-domain-containing protein [Mycena sanguinolenta]